MVLAEEVLVAEGYGVGVGELLLALHALDAVQVVVHALVDESLGRVHGLGAAVAAHVGALGGAGQVLGVLVDLFLAVRAPDDAGVQVHLLVRGCCGLFRWKSKPLSLRPALSSLDRRSRMASLARSRPLSITLSRWFVHTKADSATGTAIAFYPATVILSGTLRELGLAEDAAEAVLVVGHLVVRQRLGRVAGLP